MEESNQVKEEGTRINRSLSQHLELEQSCQLRGQAATTSLETSVPPGSMLSLTRCRCRCRAVPVFLDALELDVEDVSRVASAVILDLSFFDQTHKTLACVLS